MSSLVQMSSLDVSELCRNINCQRYILNTWPETLITKQQLFLLFLKDETADWAALFFLNQNKSRRVVNKPLHD